MALHILLVDDEPHARSHLAALLEDFPNVTVAGSVSGGTEAISFLRRTAVDLIFLDIEMGDVSGFDLARHIQSVYPKVMLVFLTGHVDFALNGYEFQPLDFLIKPVNPLRLERVILQAEEQLGKRTPKTPAVRVGLQVNGGLEIIQVDSILYIEKQGRKVYLVPAKSSRYQSYDTMQKLQGIFELYGFFRCHQSFLVRLDAMQGVYLDETRKCHKILLFGTEEQIPLSRGKYPEPLERVRRALPLCVIWGALFAITPRTGWQLALIVPLFFLLGAAVWLLLRPPLLYAAAAAVLAALIAGTLELLQTVAGPFVVPAALVLAAVCDWKRIAVLPDTQEVLIAADQRQARKFYTSTAAVLTVLLLAAIWVWYQLTALGRLLSSGYRPMVLFSAALVLAILFVLRQLAFAAVQRIEAIIDKQYQTELLNLMQIIRSQRHDFNFHIQAISGLIEQGLYSECGDYVRMMVKTTTAMNDMLPLHDPAVSAMINSFREMASQRGVELQVSISNDLQQIPCTVYEINTIIGNLIQNATDELEQNRELRSWISVLILKRGGNHIIKVTNPCHQTEDVFRNCFKPGFTTKQSHEGIGLTTAMRIVTRYHGVIFTESDEGVISFIVQVPSVFA